MTSKRILVSEGSSLSARQAITALGRAGHVVDVCDPNSLCLGRFSRFVRRSYRCPNYGSDPRGYFRFVVGRLRTGNYDVLFPTHEQAFLFSRMRATLAPLVGLAVADFSDFARVQNKISFVQLLDEICIPQPPSQVVRTEEELARQSFPFFIKTEYGTASQAVWRVAGPEDLAGVARTLKSLGLLDGTTPLLVQGAVSGQLERAQFVFDSGRLIAWHGYMQRVPGPGGGDLAKTSLLRTAARDHIERLAKNLSWHGALSFDYFVDVQEQKIAFIDCNPRLVEPVNALFGGLNLADILVKISLGEKVEPCPPVRDGVRTHMAVMALLASAARRGKRIDVLRQVFALLGHRGPFHASREELTPLLSDPWSAVPLAVVLTRLLASPTMNDRLATHTVRSYSMSAEAASLIAQLNEPPSA